MPKYARHISVCLRTPSSFPFLRISLAQAVCVNGLLKRTEQVSNFARRKSLVNYLEPYTQLVSISLIPQG